MKKSALTVLNYILKNERENIGVDGRAFVPLHRYDALRCPREATSEITFFADKNMCKIESTSKG